MLVIGSNDRRMLINGDFQWPSARMDIIKNKHGAALFCNCPGGEGCGIDQPQQPSLDVDSCAEDDGEDEDQGFL